MKLNENTSIVDILEQVEVILSKHILPDSKIDAILSNLDELRNFILNSGPDDIVYSKYNRLTNPLVRKEIFKLYSMLEQAITNESPEPIIRSYTIKLNLFFLDLLKQFKQAINKNDGYNSKDFYETKVKELSDRLIDLQIDFSHSENENEKEIIQSEINKIRTLIDVYNTNTIKTEEKKDAHTEWEKKINTAFDTLKACLNPIRDEHRRLKYLFRTYIGFAIFIILILIVLEVVICYKVHSTYIFSNLKNYFALFIPVPIAGALLWGAIFQINRAQKQMVILAGYIHHVEYAQGLLLSINSLSANVEDGIVRINSTLDKMTDNHLSQKPGSIFSEGLNTKESQPHHDAIKIASNIVKAVK